MDEERWKKAKELFHDALEQGAEERDGFLDLACRDDAELRQQVDQLIYSYNSDFMREPAAGRVAEIIGSDHRLKPDQDFGRYRIVKLIGSGGMGEVYLANDGELDRQVALKLLRSGVAEDNERVGRFIREARAASALNHPNILTIHDVGLFEDSRFIVSEFIDGPTLRERMQAGLTEAESIEITCQVAAALNAAHAAGIVHRDIKPENVMIRHDGLVKVLDFGLAKLTEADDLPIDPASPTLSPLQTSPGLIMGTVAYMSPEQARGQAVDLRTDLWSLGVVFHEMLTGESPFKGESVTDLVTSLLKHDAVSLDLKSISQELKPICTKALAKDLKTRYQSAQQLLQDLQGEKKRMEYATQPTPFVTVSSTDELKTQLIRRRPTLSAEYIVTSVKRHKYASLLTAAAVLFIGIGVSVYKYNAAPSYTAEDAVLSVIDHSTKEEDLKFSKLPVSGNVTDIAISPDGKAVAYVTASKGTRSIRLRQTETSADTELVPPVPNGLSALTFSPDGGQVFYQHSTRDAAGIPLVEIFKVPTPGGSPTKIVGGNDIDTGGSISPDGKTMAFSRELDSTEEVSLINVDGSNERTVIKAPVSGPNSIFCGDVPAWSPDGKSIACWQQFSEKGSRFYSKLATFNVTDGSHRVFNDQEFSSINAAVFMPDGNLLVTGKERSADDLAPRQLWLLPPNAPSKRITNGVTGYTGISSTLKGDVLVTVQTRNLRDIWILPQSDLSKAQAITSSGEILAGFQCMPDGRFVFSSGVSGNADIWTMNADGTGRLQLTSNHGSNVLPVVSPDDKYIVFVNSMSFHAEHVFRMDLDGRNLKQLTSAKREWSPKVSPDGKWVYYIQETPDEGYQISKVSINGGEPTALANEPPPKTNAMFIYSLFLDVSPIDGSIAYAQDKPLKDGRLRKLRIISPNGGTLIKTLELPLTTGNFFRWTPDGRSIAFGDSRNGSANIWTVAVDGSGQAKPMTNFPNPQSFSFDWSKDGKDLAVVRGSNTSDAVLIRRTK